MATAVVNYADVVADLRFRATELVKAASIIEAMMGDEEKPSVAAAAIAPPPVAAVRVAKEKAGATMADNRPTLTGTVLRAVTEGPKNPAELAARVIQLRPGTDLGEIPKTAYALKLKGKIEKRQGEWHLAVVEAEGQPPVVAAAPASKPKAAVPADREPSIRDLIREAIAKGQNPTMQDVIERVQRSRPSLPEVNIKTAIGQLIIGGEAKQTFGGVIEGVNLKMPAAMNGAAH